MLCHKNSPSRYYGAVLRSRTTSQKKKGVPIRLVNTPKPQFGPHVNQTGCNVGDQQQQRSAQRGWKQDAARLMAQQRPNHVRSDQSNESNDARHRR